ncbi:hypothetical protein [Chelatococcus sp. YT9]|uniref:hypothetical protein n=1 Tax=Chelatococcus sp. YT9 TaxID=2835635 RepID=UPI001BD0E568|nr:hypothetical protein [Chelatococcus sp. YT9]MBS7701514.1 hypothetical protein [Chelatococcus sp. YT9]MBX3556875.1 hypothetical protein [Chelatococcus sp.]
MTRNTSTQLCLLFAMLLSAAVGLLIPAGEPSIAPSSNFTPLVTICSEPSGSGRCKSFASLHGARIHMSRSASVVKITGMAVAWMGATSAFVLKNA